MEKIITWFKSLPIWGKVLLVFVSVSLSSLFCYLTLFYPWGYQGYPQDWANTDNIDMGNDNVVIYPDTESQFKPELKDLNITFLDKPLESSKDFNITFKSEDEDDVDSLFKVKYKTGVVTKGVYSETEELSYDLTNYDVYVLSALEESYKSFMYYIRIAYKDDTSPIYILYVHQTEYNDLLNETLNENVKDISSYVDHIIFDADIFKGREYGDEIVSANGNVFEFKGSLLTKTIDSQLSYLEEIDKLEGLSVYNYRDNLDGASFVKTPEGFLERVVYVPSIVDYKDNSYEPYVQLILNETQEKTDYIYDYISIGGCASNYLEVVDVKDSELKIIGKAKDGSNIYVKKDVNDSYLRKIYEQDYMEELYKYNDISADDVTPYTYTQFVNDNPVLYWKDPFNRYILFARRDYVSTGGCAKPAIYLYPQQSTGLNVKVIPNGLLTFTYPRYESNGWDVVANSNGSIEYEGNKYDYLWWDSISYGYPTPSRGWVIERVRFKDFINAKLSEMNLNSKEIEDFVEFWDPVIKDSNSKYMFVSFLFNSDVDSIAKLEFTVKPDNLFRVFMVYEFLNEYKEVKPLNIQKADRNGFSVIEWGGAKERSK